MDIILDNIHTGEINNKQLVELFGTDKQKEIFIKDKKLNSGVKKRLLTKAQKYCDIEDLTQGKYLIHKVYTTDINDAIIPLKKGLSKYLTPLILDKLLNDQDENYKITLSLLGWARQLEMINDNYPFIKYNQEKSSEYLNMDIKIVYDYFERMDECMKYHLNKCLSKLSNKRELNLIEYDSVTMVQKTNIITERNENGGFDIICNPPMNEIISDEDRKFVIDCEIEAELKAGITKPQEKFYGLTSIIYNKELKRLLSKRNISFTYNAYNIFCKNKKLVKQALSNFNTEIDEQSFIQEFHENFLEYIENKATLRQKQEFKNQEENIKKLSESIETNDNQESKIKFIKEYRLVESYVNNFKSLSELTILSDAEDFSQNIIIDNEDMMNKHNINLIY